jgi:hypothetical protein
LPLIPAIFVLFWLHSVILCPWAAWTRLWIKELLNLPARFSPCTVRNVVTVPVQTNRSPTNWSYESHFNSSSCAVYRRPIATEFEALSWQFVLQELFIFTSGRDVVSISSRGPHVLDVPTDQVTLWTNMKQKQSLSVTELYLLKICCCKLHLERGDQQLRDTFMWERVTGTRENHIVGIFTIDTPQQESLWIS